MTLPAPSHSNPIAYCRIIEFRCVLLQQLCWGKPQAASLHCVVKAAPLFSHLLQESISCLDGHGNSGSVYSNDMCARPLAGHPHWPLGTITCCLYLALRLLCVATPVWRVTHASHCVTTCVIHAPTRPNNTQHDFFSFSNRNWQAGVLPSSLLKNQVTGYHHCVCAYAAHFTINKSHWNSTPWNALLLVFSTKLHVSPKLSHC